jgi:hypothetical protein
MKAPRIRTILIAFTVVLAAAACSSFAPPATCGENLGGSADESVFSEYFSAMQLVNQDTGVAGPPGSESEVTFTRTEPIAISYSAVSSGSLRACIQARAGGGTIPFDQTLAFTEGEGSLSLGLFEPGSYVVRAIIGETLVRNLTFTIE